MNSEASDNLVWIVVSAHFYCPFVAILYKM